MLEFLPVSEQCADKLRRYYRDCPYQLCEYSVGTKLMWGGYLHPSFAEAAGCLIVRNQIEGEWLFDLPVPSPEGDMDEALTAIERYCTEQGIRPVLSVVPEERSELLVRRYPCLHLRSERVWKDYLYRAEDLVGFAGRRYSGQRNHINKFRKLCPDAVFVRLTAEDTALIEQFWTDYTAEFHKEGKMAQTELTMAQEMFSLLDRGWFCAGGLLSQGRLVALSLGEICGDTLIVHIEKALYSCPGAYPAMVQAFASHFAADMIWINREDDARDKGLRTSKLQYLPAKLGGKMRFEVGSELDSLRIIPTLKTERLTLSAFCKADRTAYNALCLDDERNRWWGYDYRKDLTGELTEDYFLSVTQEDFAARRAVNFAVRLDGCCIGEVVLYNLDWRGGAELGCRIAPSFAGHGYGTEAFAAAADWALYTLSLCRVAAKCCKENTASRRMLSSCMHPAGEDETFFYFEKQV